MNTFKFKPVLVATVLLSSTLVASCSSAPMESNSAAVEEVTESSAVENVAAKAEVPKAPPKLIKTAELALRVDSMDDVIPQVRAIAQQQQGDLISLLDNKPERRRHRHHASVKLRVPQDKLETTLESLSQLGTVQSQSISAQDVSNQLVDFQARLRNLRKTEAMLLKIMERSGSVGDVLNVAKELNEIRAQIEQIDAQLKDLRDRVAFSTITLQLEATTTSFPSEKPLDSQLGTTWSNATYSVAGFTKGLIKLGIWLLAYSPYLLVVAGIVWLGWLRGKKSSPSPASKSDSQ